MERTALNTGTALLLAGVPLVCSTWLARAVEPPKLFLFLSAVVLVLLAWLIGLRRGTFPGPQRSRVNLPLACLFGWWSLRALLAPQDPDSLDSLLTAAALGVLVVVWGSAGNWSRWMAYPVLALAVVTVYSWIQRLGLDPVAWAAPATYPTMIVDRTIATLGNPNYLGAFMVGVLPLSLLVPRGIVLFSISLGTAVLLQNRSTWLALAVSLILLLALTRRREQVKPLLIASAAGIALALGWWAFAAPERASLAVALDTRAYLWKSAAFIGLEHPLAGIEPGDYAYAALSYRRLDSALSLSLARLPEDPHNELLRIFVETGLPGVLLALGAVLWAFRQQREPHRLAALAGLLVHLLFVSATLTLQVLLVFLMATGDAETTEPEHPPSLPVLLGALALWLGATLVSFGPVKAEYHVWWGDEYTLQAQASQDQRQALQLYQQGIDQYRTALGLAWPERYPSLWTAVGSAYAKAYERAALPEVADPGLDAFAAAARLEPANPLPYAGMAQLLSLQARLQPDKRAEAVEMWRKAVERDPYNPHYLANLAGELANAGKLEESTPFFEESLTSWESPLVLLQYGRVLCRLGRVGEALAHLERARELDSALDHRVQEALEECRKQ